MTRFASPLLIGSTAVLLAALPLSADSLKDRIRTVQAQRAAQASQNAAATEGIQGPTIAQRMNGHLTAVRFNSTPAQKALAWWTERTGVPLLVQWQQLEEQGLDLQAPVTLNLENVPARTVLKLILEHLSPDLPMVVEGTPWYVEVLTKADANQRRVTRIYDVADLLVPTLDHVEAPKMELGSALNTRSAGGGSGGSGSGGGSGSIFGSTSTDQGEKQTSAERGERLAQVVRDVVEKDVWQENGGESTIRYYDKRLIINAPMYVHRQIGIPAITIQPVTPGMVTQPQHNAPAPGSAAAAGSAPAIAPAKPQPAR